MKKVFFLMLAVASLGITSSFARVNENKTEKEISSPQYQSEFCEGWEDGYCEGWKQIKGGYAICPITPICPIPKIGESSDSYRDGYNRGFLAGMRAAQRD